MKEVSKMLALLGVFAFTCVFFSCNKQENVAENNEVVQEEVKKEIPKRVILHVGEELCKVDMQNADYNGGNLAYWENQRGNIFYIIVTEIVPVTNNTCKVTYAVPVGYSLYVYETEYITLNTEIKIATKLTDLISDETLPYKIVGFDYNVLYTEDND